MVKEGEKCWVLTRAVVTCCKASLCRPSDSFGCKPNPRPEFRNAKFGDRGGIVGKMPGWSGLSGWIVGLLRTYMTSVARAAGHWVLGCRDCLGKLLRQLRARGTRGKRQGGLKAGLLAQRQTQERRQPPVSLAEPRTPTHSRNFSRHPQMHVSIPHHQKRQNSHQNNVILSSFVNAKKGGHRMFLGGSADARIG